jgi:hypothetical protein
VIISHIYLLKNTWGAKIWRHHAFWPTLKLVRVHKKILHCLCPELSDRRLETSLTTLAVITCFCYVLIILLDHKKVRFSHLFQMCSKSISNDIIRFSPFCSNENMRFSYILIILSECNKSRWSLHLTQALVYVKSIGQNEFSTK